MRVADRLDRQYDMYADEYNAAALRALKSGWYILGPEVKAFEEDFAKAMNSCWTE